MIIKAMTSRKTEGWRFYEADEVQSYKDDYSVIKMLPRNMDEVHYIQFTDDCGDCGDGGRWAVVSFEGKSGPVEITTNLPVFLLNEKGATIDRIG